MKRKQSDCTTHHTTTRRTCALDACSRLNALLRLFYTFDCLFDCLFECLIVCLNVCLFVCLFVCAHASIAIQLKHDKWLNEGTRVLFVDFTLYNAFINHHIPVNIMFEFPAMGGVLVCVR